MFGAEKKKSRKEFEIQNECKGKSAMSFYENFDFFIKLSKF